MVQFNTLIFCYNDYKEMEVIMKKWIWLIMIIFLVGCQVDALEYYQEASEKTSTIEDGQSELDMSLELDFNIDVKDQNPELDDFFGSIVYEQIAKFSKEQTIARQYIGNDAIGMDLVYYKNYDEEYLKVPYLGKYLSLLDLNMNSDLYAEPPFSKASEEEIKRMWLALVSEEDVVNLGDEVIDTPEGEVKVKKFVISFSHDQVQAFMNEVLILLENDAKFIEQLPKYQTYNYSDGEFETYQHDLDAEQMMNGIHMFMDNIVVEEFKMTAYIDIDKYIVHHVYDVKLSFKDFMKEVLDEIRFHADYQLFDMHEKQELEFPELNDNEFVTIEELLEGFEAFRK